MLRPPVPSILLPGLLLGTTLVAGGCAPSAPPTFEGRRVYEAFPFEPAGREWDYKSDNADLSYRMVGLQAEKAETVETSTKLWQIDVTAQCFNDTGACADLDMDGNAQDIDETVLEVWKISAEFISGVRVWQMGEVVYDPPVLLVEGRAQVGDVVETTSGGITFTSTYEGPEDCPGSYFEVDTDAGEERVECEKIVVTDAGAGSLLAGTWWAVAPYGIVQFQREVDQGSTWSMRKFKDESSR
ncbi:MAG: hypothetical protein H6732_19120 [Alphaproteobacteria bacterium]|nr:hypothetical protein [Alphaproteobacteria bacterium]